MTSIQIKNISNLLRRTAILVLLLGVVAQVRGATYYSNFDVDFDTTRSFTVETLNSYPELGLVRYVPSTTFSFDEVRVQASAGGVDNLSEFTEGTTTLNIYEFTNDALGAQIATSTEFNLSQIASNSGGSDCIGNIRQCDYLFHFPNYVELHAGTPYYFSLRLLGTAVGHNDYNAAHDNFINTHFYAHLNGTEDNKIGLNHIMGTYYNGRSLLFELRTKPIYITKDIHADTTWNSKAVYVVSGEVAIASGVTLTLEEGTVVKFDTTKPSGLIVAGTLIATGFSNEAHPTFNPVIFTSLKDDYAGDPADTNDDGDYTSPSEEDWAGIKIESGGVARLTGSIIRYAGLDHEGGLRNSGTLSLESSIVTHNGAHGIYTNTGSVQIVNTDISFHEYGLYVSGGMARITATSSIHHNKKYGVYNETLTTIHAEGNYWGTNTGPSSTYGSAVLGLVDYTPYLERLYNVKTSCIAPAISCASVTHTQLIFTKNTAYSRELDGAVRAWSSLSDSLTFFEGSGELHITDTYAPDYSFKGAWAADVLAGDGDRIELNRYYLDHDSFTERQHTISHELGHAIGLTHSDSGNLMFHNQTTQLTPGLQDLRDYYYLWLK